MTEMMAYSFNVSMEEHQMILDFLRSRVDNLHFHKVSNDVKSPREKLEVRPAREWISGRLCLQVLQEIGRPVSIDEIAEKVNIKRDMAGEELYKKRGVYAALLALYNEGDIQRLYRGVYSL